MLLMGVRGSTWSSVLNIGAGAPGGVSDPWARAAVAGMTNAIVKRSR